MGQKWPSRFFWKSFGIPAVFAIAGFLFAYLLVCVSFSSRTPYSELVLDRKKEVIENYLVTRKQGLLMLFSEQKKKGRGSDSTNRVTQALNTTSKELFDLRTGYTDTSYAFFIRYFNVNRDDLSSALIDSAPRNNYFYVPIRVNFIDTTTILSDTFRTSTNFIYLTKRNYQYKTQFFRQHSEFALWVVFSLVQMMIWFFLLPLLLARLHANQKELQAASIPWSPRDLIKSLITPALVLIIFAVVFFNFMVDQYVILDHYFLSSFNDRIRFYLLPAYIFSGLYFSLFLLLAKLMTQVNNFKKDQQVVKTITNNLSATFRLAFFATAITLSLAVIWMGILYSAANSMEAVRYYNLINGQPFISHDPVYLTGLLHSILLLIFYLPVKLHFDFEQSTEGDQKEGTNVLNNIWKAAASVAVTASPLLSAGLQKFLSSLMG